MKLKELKQKLSELPDRFLDCEVRVNTDCVEFSCHMVDITNVHFENKENVGIDMIYLTLDDGCKIFRKVPTPKELKLKDSFLIIDQNEEINELKKKIAAQEEVINMINLVAKKAIKGLGVKFKD